MRKKKKKTYTIKLERSNSYPIGSSICIESRITKSGPRLIPPTHLADLMELISRNI